MKKLSALVTIIFAIIAFVSSCKKDDTTEAIPYTTTPYVLNIPSNLPIMDIPANNQLTVEGVALGRRLYYDSLLDQNQARACASCHLQQNGFTTLGTQGNMPVVPHINLGYSTKFLWDGRKQGTLEDAMVFEVEEFFKTDVSVLQASSVYPDMYLKAFGTSTITTKNTAYAMAQFLRTMISGNSKFDRYVRHEESFTTEETEGFMVFYTEKGDCFHCHSLSLMTDGNLHNNGLDSIFTTANSGYYNTSGNIADLGKFKSPSLRNVALRTSFMHDGRFTTLEEVIEHYNSEVKITPSVDPIMTKAGKEDGLNLTPYEMNCLKIFLQTLTDTSYTNNPAFSSPFK